MIQLFVSLLCVQQVFNVLTSRSPSSSWFNWLKSAKEQVSVASRDASGPSWHTESSIVWSLCSDLHFWTVSCESALLSNAAQASHYRSLCAPYLHPCLYVPTIQIAANLFCTLEVSNVLVSLLYTVWPHVQRRQYSSCYRVYNVRVVMFAAPRDIPSFYLRSAENVLNKRRTCTNLNDLSSRINDTHEKLLYTVFVHDEINMIIS